MANHSDNGILARVLGPDARTKWSFVRNQWLRHYWPRFLRRRAEIARGRRGRLEDLFVFLTNACNARCKHCFYIDELGHVPGELRLEDYEKLAPTLPRMERLIFTGGEAILHPQCAGIVEVLARATRAGRVSFISNGFLPAKLESMCGRLCAEKRLPGPLDVLISIDGMRDTHNAIRGNPRAWDLVNESLGALARVKKAHPDRIDLGVVTIITDRNWTELEALNDHVRANYPVRHGFEFVRGTRFSLWDLPEEYRTDFNPPGIELPPEDKWDEILETLQRINRRNGIENHSFHLTARYTVQMLRTKQKIVDCVSAGQNVGVMYPKGELAVCEFSKPFGNVRDYGLDFARAWDSPEADAMRRATSRCYCTHGCYLSKNIEYSLTGQAAMLRHL